MKQIFSRKVIFLGSCCVFTMVIISSFFVIRYTKHKIDLNTFRNIIAQNKLSPEMAASIADNKTIEQARRVEARDPEAAIAMYREVAKQKPISKIEAKTVGFAQYRIGMLRADQKKYSLASREFNVLSKKNITVPAMAQERSFGSWSDQGEYQAAICLHKDNAPTGEKAMESFINHRIDSPLIYAAYKRLLAWNNDKETPSMKVLWHQIKSTEKKHFFEASACGPKALEYVLAQYGYFTDWKLLAKECKTDTSGTSMQGLSFAAGKHGFKTVGMKVSAEALKKLNAPFIQWDEIMQHYFVIDQKDKKWIQFDPENQTVKPFEIKKLSESWRCYVLTFSKSINPSSNNNTSFSTTDLILGGSR